MLANFCGGKKQPLKQTATNMKVCFKAHCQYHVKIDKDAEGNIFLDKQLGGTV